MVSVDDTSEKIEFMAQPEFFLFLVDSRRGTSKVYLAPHVLLCGEELLKENCSRVANMSS